MLKWTDFGYCDNCKAVHYATEDGTCPTCHSDLYEIDPNDFELEELEQAFANSGLDINEVWVWDEYKEARQAEETQGNSGIDYITATLRACGFRGC
jgi:hypothetical protein